MVQALEGPIQVETLRETPQSASQPAFQPDPVKLDEKTVRAAMLDAAQRGEDPFKMTVGDLDKAGQPPPAPAAPPTQAGTPVDVPEKFKKPNGEVDVEKLKASTERLDEAIAQKETKLADVNKFVEDQLLAYKEKERKFNSLPNPERLAAQLPPPVPAPMPNQPMSNEQLEALINQDIQRNPARTISELVRLALQNELKPIVEDRRDNQIRTNLKQLAEKDVRVVEHIAAINAKLDSDPELWKLKNPHKAAWLEVKEDLRLGDAGASQSPAQPSKPSAPILGGGTPPPAPSLSEARTTAQTLNAAIDQLSFDPRKGKIDPNHQKLLDQAAKEFFDNQERLRPR